MTAQPTWWRGEPRAESPRGEIGPAGVMTGRHSGFDLPPVDDRDGLRDLYLFRATVTDAELSLDDVHLRVEWSELEGCRFRQRVRPVTNEQGFAAQGTLGIGASVYRNCTFERVRFKLLGGFSLGAAMFEGCTFLNCRWEGHFAHDAYLVDNRFVGRMDGCVWFGRGDDDGTRRMGAPNLIRGNDFTETRFTTNVAWRSDFPLQDQRWPDGFVPVVDD